jgi:hypothetical protein
MRFRSSDCTKHAKRDTCTDRNTTAPTTTTTTSPTAPASNTAAPHAATTPLRLLDQ